MSGCCIVSSSSYMMTCAQDSTGRAADGRKYGCHATKTCTTSEESAIGLIIFLCIICCPCALVLGIVCIIAVFIVVLAIIFMSFPILLIVITIASGGTAAPFTCGLLCVWGCLFCGVVYAIFRMVKNIGKDDEW